MSGDICLYEGSTDARERVEHDAWSGRVPSDRIFNEMF